MRSSSWGICSSQVKRLPTTMALDPKHEAFTTWAKERGVTINGVAPAKLPGKGFGIVATRQLKVSQSAEQINRPKHSSVPVQPGKHDVHLLRRSAETRTHSLRPGIYPHHARLGLRPRSRHPARNRLRHSRRCTNTEPRQQRPLVCALASNLAHSRRLRIKHAVVLVRRGAGSPPRGGEEVAQAPAREI